MKYFKKIVGDKIYLSPINSDDYLKYTEWLNEVQTIYNELVNLGIYSGRLIAHEQIDDNIFLVSYQLENTQIKICLNYSFSSYTVGSTVVAAKSYEVIK